MAVATNSFDDWLSKKLQDLKTDEGIFGSYIKGILQGDETEEEKIEALEGILTGITEDDINNHVTEILKVWEESLPNKEKPGPKVPVEDVDVRLARMLESQSLPTTTQRSYTDEEKKIREAILAQYSQMSEEENSEGDGEEDGASGGDCGIEKNTNAAAIIQQEKEKREKAKLESQRKKEKDKEDREKQKQLREEKKEKRKTQKGERRR
ncbi:coiled-coil domain-containing protein 43 [Apis mellifera caucasica]|uniref:Coiled-coil domain-containing protein 43 n=1 Tax=Apis mellifera TaxID=7460 RepID=A0A7M7R7E5_APIME|nr:coiled-coil domain-containing protein 43 [Apis mellifera]KAG6796450.1 coiled-coil domain-containing protein 43 [Apis mellifera caucasica]KAG9436782.1 coiled-coil domain-containing protein 43 [Apis mellifera carnica]|eukprot:XP_623500.2 coiled-coil domain-containing protein 43 [Apis mellifera]